MDRSCPVCDSGDIDIRSSYRGAHKTFSGLMRARCRSCGMYFATPMPGNETLAEYNASYFASAHGGSPTNTVALAFFSGIADLRVAYVERYLNLQKISVSSLLEFGPGPGFFAAKWLGRHPETSYMACETDTSCHDALVNLGVRLIDAHSSPETTAPVDLVVMSHVLEHAADPRVFLQHATRTLRKGGALFIEVPCLDFKHKLIDEPHLLFFDKKPMQHLLSTAGFVDVKVAYFGQEIEGLRSTSAFQRAWLALRSRLIGHGLIAPFAWNRRGMETLGSPIERAVVAPFKAHCESLKPAWWLRAVARKQ